MLSAELIQRARKRAGLSRAQLASRLAVHQSAVGRWERGEATPTMERLTEITAATGFRLNTSLTPADDHDRVLVRRSLLQTPTERLDELTNAVRGLKDLGL